MKPKNCNNCYYGMEGEIDQNLERKLQCVINPPVATAIATPQGVMVMTLFPQVNIKMVCGKFVERPPEIKQ